jgi:hypothetical protein
LIAASEAFGHESGLADCWFLNGSIVMYALVLVADVSGQFSLYGARPADAVLRAAPYNHFFKKDYDPIMQVIFQKCWN